MLGQCRKGLSRAALVALAMGLASPAAMAATTDFKRFEGFSNARQVSDEELGGMRGRFVAKGRLMFFGVQMMSEWRTAAGETLRAGARVNGDLRGQAPTLKFEPTLTVFRQAGSQATQLSGEGGNGATVSNAGVANVSGVVQSIQAGGDFNSAANDLQIDVLDAGSIGGSRGGAGGAATRSVAGTQLSVAAHGSDMRVAIDIPGMGSVRQAIVPGRGLQQSIQLTSSLQQVRNLTRLQLYVGDRNVPGGDMPGLLSGIRAAAALR
ncbi:hypothetical protein ACUN9Y_00825 [Halomonas sp. V046]|uniref:hypothetical protein n=1 Tax=Halomonas sp. V046 TaxID=3459611 RepID=UPI004044DDDD